MSENDYGLMEQFMRIGWLLRRHSSYAFKEGGPMRSPYHGQGRVLKLLRMQPKISQKDLSYLLDMRPQSLGELLNKLEKSGYITRAQSQSDKRVVDICLTEEGIQAADEDERQSGFGEPFGCLSGEEQANLGGYLGRVIEELERRQDDGGHEKFEHGGRGGYGFGHERHGGHFGRGPEHPRDGRGPREQQ